MNSLTISRAFLQGLHQQRKREAADQLIRQHVDVIQNFAAEGKTSYMFELANTNTTPPHNTLRKAPVITTDDFVAAFQRKFPDCTVTYQEEWIDIDPTKRVLKKGIVIDWSQTLPVDPMAEEKAST